MLSDIPLLYSGRGFDDVTLSEDDNAGPVHDGGIDISVRADS